MTTARTLAVLSVALALCACRDEPMEPSPGQPPVVDLGEPLEDAPDLAPIAADTGMLAKPVGELPDHYRFVDEQGAERTFADLRGRFVVVDFIFTSCTGPCPPMAEQMGRLQERLAGVPDVTLLSISVDPRTDTPEVLRDYAASVGAEAGRWQFARMPIDFVNDLTRQEFLVGDGGTPLAHTMKFLLVDRQGRGRAHYDPLVDPGWIDKLLGDLDRLRAEPAQ